MPKFSRRSKEKLSTCDERLQKIFNEVVKKWDCSIICGHRTKEDQDKAYYGRPQRSKVKYPNSKHNGFPSKAVDVAPYPIDWNDLGAFYMFAGYVMRVADSIGVRIRYGGDWDGDKTTADQRFNDLPHFELIG